MAFRRLPTLCLLVLAALTVPASANHVQPESGRSVSFDHRAGNEWWVEVLIGGPDASRVVRVEGIDTDGVWTTMPKQNWGAYAASFHIEPGHQVRFRATFSDGVQTVSCWFDHPSGTERCGTPPLPAGWRATKAFTSGPDAGMWVPSTYAAGDVDRDGIDEVFVPHSDAMSAHERRADGTWSSAEVVPAYGASEYYAVATGDVDGDGHDEAYIGGVSGNGGYSLHRTHWSGTGYVTNLVFSLANPVMDLEVGDIEDDGDLDLYVTTSNGFGQGAAYAVDRVGTSNTIATISTSPNVRGMFSIGDADRDGDDELWALGSEGFGSVDWTGSGYQTTITGPAAVDEQMDIIVGDGDGDGREEVYVLRIGAGDASRVDRHSFRTDGTWSSLSVPLPGPRRAYALALGDADGNGARELYAGDEDGRVFQVRWTGSAWAATHVATIGSGHAIFDLVFGDTRGDGRERLVALATGYTGFCCPPVEGWEINFASATPPPAFDATFSGVRGNEWWVQANVAVTGGTLSAVEVRIDSAGDWLPLTRQSWGGWAASYHIGEGDFVQLRARSTTGATDLSGCYVWIPPAGQDAARCGDPQATAFDATFSNAKGNEWWVQVQVAPNSGHTLSAVHARVNGGDWFALQKQSWGPNDYAVSRHIPDGSTVQFRATDQGGATDLSGCYRWIPSGGGLAASVAC